jgi:hypothetical protein
MLEGGTCDHCVSTLTDNTSETQHRGDESDHKVSAEGGERGGLMLGKKKSESGTQRRSDMC